MNNVTKKLVERIANLSDEAIVELLHTGDAIQISEKWDNGEMCGGESVTIQLVTTKK